MLPISESIDANIPVGMINPSLTSIVDGWLLCDGSTFDALLYPELNALLGGNTLPDLVERFPRATTNQAEINGFVLQGYLTRLPRTGNWTLKSGGGHTHKLGTSRSQFRNGTWRGSTDTGDNDYTDYAGSHNHTS